MSADAENGSVRSGAVEESIIQQVPHYGELSTEDQARLREMAATLSGKGMPPDFVASSLRATAEVLRDLRDDEVAGSIFQREHVRRFIEQHAVPEPPRRLRYNPRSERKQEERDRLQSNTLRLLREARQARARHEVKKTRNMLLKVDQRELRRRLGREGEDLCRQINTWLRSNAPA
jgi:hypothetical protein